MNSKWTELQFYNSRIRLSYDKTVPRETELGKKKVFSSDNNNPNKLK